MQFEAKKFADLRLLHCLNAFEPMEVTAAGMVTEYNPL